MYANLYICVHVLWIVSVCVMCIYIMLYTIRIIWPLLLYVSRFHRIYLVPRYNKFNSPDKNVRVDFWNPPTEHLLAAYVYVFSKTVRQDIRVYLRVYSVNQNGYTVVEMDTVKILIFFLSGVLNHFDLQNNVLCRYIV